MPGEGTDRFDWVGLWKRGGRRRPLQQLLTFAYTGATVADATRIRLDRATYPPGEYVMRLMRDDDVRLHGPGVSVFIRPGDDARLWRP